MKPVSLVKGSGLVAASKQVGAHSTGCALAAPVPWLQCGTFLEETEASMDQRDASVLRVVRGRSGVWEVQAAGFDPIKIAGPNRRPYSVDDRGPRMQQSCSSLVDLDPCLQECKVVRSSRVKRSPEVALAWQDQLDVDASRCTILEGANQLGVGTK